MNGKNFFDPDRFFEKKKVLCFVQEIIAALLTR